ncbi:D-alanyl-D-alanine carboxypeptidase [Blastococcus sp. TF02-09]|nr:D-alanyl-D-alanine carboxypeptidase [Blastococcus sp. TF02-9]
MLLGYVGLGRVQEGPVPVTAGPAIAWPVQGQAAYTTSVLDAIRADGVEGPVPIASVTKVMTAYVVLQERPLEQGEAGATIPVTGADVADMQRRQANGESVVAVAAGEDLTQLQALYALMLPSANNVAVLLARSTAGSVDAFVELMNRAADDLGMDDTVYTDPSGMADDTVSTAADQVRLFDAALRDPVFAAVAGATAAELPVAGTVVTTSRLLGQDGFVAGKTGSHDAAGGCYVFRVVRTVAGREVVITGAVLGQRGGPYIEAALRAAEALTAQVAASPDVRAG